MLLDRWDKILNTSYKVTFTYLSENVLSDEKLASWISPLSSNKTNNSKLNLYLNFTRRVANLAFHKLNFRKLASLTRAWL